MDATNQVVQEVLFALHFCSTFICLKLLALSKFVLFSPPLWCAKVFYADENDGRIYDEHLLRKQELRELKMLQKAEQKQFQDLTVKAQTTRDQQERRFDQETTSLLRGYETELETLTRSQKMQVERAEQQQDSDLRFASKKIRSEQVPLLEL